MGNRICPNVHPVVQVGSRWEGEAWYAMQSELLAQRRLGLASIQRRADHRMASKPNLASQSAARGASRVLHLQRVAGNAAVSSLFARPTPITDAKAQGEIAEEEADRKSPHVQRDDAAPGTDAPPAPATDAKLAVTLPAAI